MNKRPKTSKSRSFKKNQNIRLKDIKTTVSVKNPYLSRYRGLSDSFAPKSSASHHDKFFKLAFSEPEIAKELVQLILTTKELKTFNLKNLKVEDQLSKAEKMDLILSFGLKNIPKKRAHVLILVEHKSQYSKKTYQQILMYQILLFLIFIKKPTILIPVIFYHGKKPWNHKISFQKAVLGDFFEKIPSTIKKNMLECEPRIVDTNSKILREFFKNMRSKASLAAQTLDKNWVLRHDRETLRKLLLSIFDVFKNREALRSFSDYFEAVGVSWETLKEIEQEGIKKGLLKKGGYMGFSNRRENILQEGRQEGRHEGWQERNYEVVVNMLKEKADTAFISKVTGVSVKEIKKLKNGS